MRSRLFRAIFEDAESQNAKSFVRDARELLALNDRARKACLDALPKMLRPTTDFETRQLVTEVVKQTSEEQHRIERSLSVLDFLVKALLSEDVPADDHKNWAADLANVEGFHSTDSNAFASIVDELARDQSSWRLQEREIRASAGVTPRFKSMGVTVEARAIRRDKYRWGTPVDRYEPEILGVAYVASVSIGMTEGLPEEVYFQMDERDIDNMIGSLTAAKKELDALRKYFARSKDVDE